jgi:hypothetical protein
MLTLPLIASAAMQARQSKQAGGKVRHKNVKHKFVQCWNGLLAGCVDIAPVHLTPLAVVVFSLHLVPIVEPGPRRCDNQLARTPRASSSQCPSRLLPAGKRAHPRHQPCILVGQATYPL